MPKSTSGCAVTVLCGIALGVAVALGALVLLQNSSVSNNKGKIEGKWKQTESFHADAGSKQAGPMLDAIGLYFYLDFKPDEILEMGEAGEKPEAIEFLKRIKESGAPSQDLVAKYQLRSGNRVDVFFIPDGVRNTRLFGKNRDAKAEIRIEGDTMVVTNDEGQSSKFVRVK